MKNLLLLIAILIFSYFISNAGTRYSVNNADWDNSSTWSTTSGGASGASVPNNNDNVIIERGYVVTVNSTEHCQNVTILSGSGDDTKLIIDDNGDLTVDENVLLSTQNNNNKAEIEIVGTSGSPGVMTISGDLSMKAYDNQDDAKVKIKDDGVLTVTGDMLLWSDGDQKAELKIENDGVAAISGDIIFEGNEMGRSKVNMNDNARLNLAGNFDRSATGNYGDLDSEISTTINFNGSSSQTLSMINYGGSVTEKWNYGEVLINNSAGVTLDASVSQSNSAYTVKDDIRIQSGQLNSGGFSIELANSKVFQVQDNTTYYTTTTDATGGMLSTSTTATHDIQNNSTVNFAAGSPQNVPSPTGSSAYGNLIVSNGAAKTLTNDIVINNNLNLAGGNLVLGANNLTMGVDATVSGASTSSYVQADNTGVMKKNFDAMGSPFDFPVGDVNEFSPFWFKLQGGTAFGGNDFISVNVSDGVNQNMDSGDQISRSWGFNGGGFTSINYNLKATYVEEDVIGTESNIIPSIFNGSSWTQVGTINPATNTISNSTGVTDIPNNFQFSGGSGGALPIVLNTFTAVAQHDHVVIEWTTATEINNDFFTLERSSDGIDYEEITRIPGQGTTYLPSDYSYTDFNPFSNITYYRLTQTDLNGKFKQFSPLSVKLEMYSNPIMKIYPNPVMTNQPLKVQIDGLNKDKEIVVILVDQYGREVFSKVVMKNNNNILTALDLKDRVKPGLYYVIGSSDHTIYRQRLIITDPNSDSPIQ